MTDQTPAEQPEAQTRRAVGVRRGMFGGRGSGDVSGYGGLVQPVLEPESAPRPYGGWFDECVDVLLDVVGPGAVTRVVVFRGELTLHVPRAHLVAVARALRDEPRLRFEMCASVSGVHVPDDVGREHHVVTHLLSMTHNRRVRIEVTAPEDDARVPSLVATYPTADWHEREVWDMFGVVFDGHPSLTRILMPDDWPGHPQRKDYPLGGIDVTFKGATVPPPDQRRSYS